MPIPGYRDPNSDLPPGIENKLSTWKGPSIPLTKVGGGRLHSGELKDVIRSSIIIILGTPLGSVFHEPEFGSSINELLYEPNDIVLRGVVRQYVIEAVTRWEPRVKLLDSNISADNNNLYITLHYFILDLGLVDQLRLQAARFAPAGSLSVVPDSVQPSGVTY